MAVEKHLDAEIMKVESSLEKVSSSEKREQLPAVPAANDMRESSPVLVRHCLERYSVRETQRLSDSERRISFGEET